MLCGARPALPSRAPPRIRPASRQCAQVRSTGDADGHDARRDPLFADSTSPTAPSAADGAATVGIGSVLLLTEVLAKPLRDDPASREVASLTSLLSRIELRALDTDTATLALEFAVSYRLRAADATHVATAVAGGATMFLTNNRRDFTRHTTEIDIVSPDELPDPAELARRSGTTTIDSPINPHG